MHVYACVGARGFGFAAGGPAGIGAKGGDESTTDEAQIECNTTAHAPLGLPVSLSVTSRKETTGPARPNITFNSSSVTP